MSTAGRILPASKGEVHDLEAELADYKTETTILINSLVGEVNSLTPVGFSLWQALGRFHLTSAEDAHATKSLRECNSVCSMQGYNGTNGLNGINGTMGALPWDSLTLRLE